MTSSALKATLQSDLTESIRSRDELRSSTLRLALTAVKTAEVSGKVARDLSDDEVLSALAKEAKKRREAATAFADAGRPERAERELAELAVLEAYLPKQLSDDELRTIVTAAVAAATDSGASGMAAMGKVIKAAQAAAEGRAEGGRIAAEVKRQLAG
jgi:hypothetical protein